MDVSPLDEEAVFYVARRVEDREAREAYLRQVCGGDAALRARVDDLLSICEREAGFLEVPPYNATMDMAAPVETPGTSIGPYKLMEAIGEGGMGTVFMAEQSEPVRRRVALKVIKPGMDSRQVVARFEAERQALALMDHPNIARVHDAGATASGRPYFVMELVRGLPITEYCDREQLSIPERLELFTLVCRAVQHAHQKGVIHRDLKPSNILVTVIDGVPVPKVIDFGIAKATGGTLTEMTLFTGFHQFVGTPLYVSPEQAELSGVDVDTRSDIYSLGVLLYELLTGTTPFDSETLKKAAFDEMRRMIREDEPPRPSTRLSSLGERLSTVSASRKADPRRLGPSLRGELDWVVMKAMEKDRRRRYETANDFAADVMRYLTDQPVVACPPTNRYRVAKFAHRNRAILTTGVVVVLALVAGMAGSLWQAVRATAAEKHAILAQEQAEDHLVLGLQAVDDLYDQVASRWLGDLRWGVTLPRPLLEKTLPFYQTFIERRRVNPIAGRAYNRISEIQIQLREFAEAERALGQAQAIWNALLAIDPENPEHLQNLAKSYAIQSDLPQSWDRRYPALQQAITLRRKLADRFPTSVRYAKDLATSYTALASHRIFTDHAAADDPLQHAREIQERLSRENPTDDELLCDLGATYRGFSEFHLSKQRAGEAEPYVRRALAIHDDLLTRHPTRPRYLMHVMWDLLNFGHALANTRQFEEVTRVSDRAATICLGLRNDYPDQSRFLEFQADALGLKAVGLAQTGHHAEADVLLVRMESLVAATKHATILAQIAWHEAQKDAPRVADPAHAVTLANRAVALAPNHIFAWHVLGMSRYRAGQWDGAITALKKANSLEHDAGFSVNGFFLAMCYHQKGDHEQARSWYDRSVAWMAKRKTTDPNAFKYRDEAAQVLGLPLPD